MKCEIKPIFCIGKCHYEDDSEKSFLCVESHLFYAIANALQRLPIAGRFIGDYHCPYFEIRKDETNATQPEKQ